MCVFRRQEYIDSRLLNEYLLNMKPSHLSPLTSLCLMSDSHSLGRSIDVKISWTNI